MRSIAEVLTVQPGEEITDAELRAVFYSRALNTPVEIKGEHYVIHGDTNVLAIDANLLHQAEDNMRESGVFADYAAELTTLASTQAYAAAEDGEEYNSPEAATRFYALLGGISIQDSMKAIHAIYRTK